MSNAPIGIFDSGVGGLTVARAILDQLPNESTIYLGDTARGPFGPRTLAEVRDFSLESLDFLVEQGVKAIVIACNTASAAMLRDARKYAASKHRRGKRRERFLGLLSFVVCAVFVVLLFFCRRRIWSVYDICEMRDAICVLSTC